MKACFLSTTLHVIVTTSFCNALYCGKIRREGLRFKQEEADQGAAEQSLPREAGLDRRVAQSKCTEGAGPLQSPFFELLSPFLPFRAEWNHCVST